MGFKRQTAGQTNIKRWVPGVVTHDVCTFTNSELMLAFLTLKVDFYLFFYFILNIELSFGFDAIFRLTCLSSGKH